MGQKERLLGYWRKLRGMYHRSNTASESGVHPDLATSRIYEVAIREYGIPDKTYVDTGADNQRFLRCQATKEDVEEALRKTRKLGRVVREYNESVPAQPEKSAIELVLERAMEIGEITP